jgi:hypothetical protein
MIWCDGVRRRRALMKKEAVPPSDFHLVLLADAASTRTQVHCLINFHDLSGIWVCSSFIRSVRRSLAIFEWV